MLLANPALAYTLDAPTDYVETVTDMQQRQDYWWTSLLTRSFRRCIALRTKHPQLLIMDKWEMLVAQFELTMKSATHKRAIKQVCMRHKDFVLATSIHMGYHAPMIARPDCSSEATAASTDKRPKIKVLMVPMPAIHYRFSCFVVHQVEALQFRSEDIDAMGAEQSDMGTIGAKPPEDQPAKKTIPQRMISRSNKQSQRAFFDMCRSVPGNLPYYAFQEHAETLNAETSQDIRHLALIDMKGCTYQQLLLTNSQLFRVVQKKAESVSLT